MSAPIGRGEWSAQVVSRGGSPVLYELPYTSISKTHVLNTASTAQVAVSSAGRSREACCVALADSEPWRDEILLYRGNTLVHAGPLLTVKSNLGGGSFDSQDLFHWMEVRVLEDDFYSSGDIAHIFNSVFHEAYDKEDSPNISIQTRATGVDGVREVKGEESHRAADLMRELARTGLDFTMVGRTILGGGLEVFEDRAALILHDDGVLSAEVTKEGTQFATDVSVFSGTREAGGSPITGRAVRSSELYGLIQRSATELLIEDAASADANALARLEAMQPAPLRLSVTFSDKTGFEYEELVPGRRVDCRLSEASGCVEVMGEMRLLSVQASVSRSDDAVSETVTADLVPLGVSETT